MVRENCDLYLSHRCAEFGRPHMEEFGGEAGGELKTFNRGERTMETAL
jgi:hypothetical protein